MFRERYDRVAPVRTKTTQPGHFDGSWHPSGQDCGIGTEKDRPVPPLFRVKEIAYIACPVFEIREHVKGYEVLAMDGVKPLFRADTYAACATWCAGWLAGFAYANQTPFD